MESEQAASGRKGERPGPLELMESPDTRPRRGLAAPRRLARSSIRSRWLSTRSEAEKVGQSPRGCKPRIIHNRILTQGESDMPGGDRTGPMGMGPMTGRGAGYCVGMGAPGFVNRTFGGFFGRGRGGGRGWRNMFHATGLPGWARAGVGVVAPAVAGAAAPSAATPAAGFQSMTPQQELDALKQQARQAADVLASVQQRISELEAGAAP